jgi:hypothetical protein
MTDAEYLRQQAANCLRLARSTFDLATAERLRHMAADFQARAEDLQQQPEPIHAHMIRRNGYSQNGSSGDNGHG